MLPWIEKYRPNNFMDIKINKQLKMQIEIMIRQRDVPNIILEGPPGVGKTTTIRCIARELYHKYYTQMVLEINASDNRGIEIYDIINNFRKLYVHIDKKDIPNFKMIILDEADNMTEKAEHIISNFIKEYDKLKFAFTCNTKENIISSIQSNCHLIKYPPLDNAFIISNLHEICIKENIITKKTKNIVNDGLKSIALITNGDMRHAINILQITHCRYNTISSEYVYIIQDVPQPEKLKYIITCCIKKDIRSALQNIIDMRNNNGYSGTDIIIGMFNVLKHDICNDINESTKIELLKCIYKSYNNISRGMDSSMLQITACIADIYKTIHK